MSPSIASQVAERAEGLHRKEARSDFFKLMRLLLKHGSIPEARDHAKVERSRERVQNILAKASVAPGSLTEWSAIADYTNISTTFLESLRGISVFDTALDNGMVRAPPRSRGFSVTTGISGSVPNELAVKVISQLVLGQQLVEPKKATATIVVSKELLDYAESAALFNNELQRGVIAATDSVFIASLIAATTPVASSGSTAAQIAVDLETILSNVTTHAGSRLIFVTSPTNLKGILGKLSGGATPFPNLGPLGGELWPGVVAIPSDVISSSAAVLFDATALAGSSEGIIPARSTQGTLQMESISPDSPPVASTVLLSLWQTDNVALRAERFFAYTILRASGVASLSGVNY